MEIREHEIYTLEETTSLLKISRSTFLRLIKKGILNACKVGGQYRILGREILTLFNPKLQIRARAVYKNMKNKIQERMVV